MEDFDVFTLDDVDAAFEHFVQLKYSQHVPIQGIENDSSIIYSCRERRHRYRDYSIRCRPHVGRNSMENQEGYRGHCLCCRLQSQEGKVRYL
jgi:hypothetical protein